MTTTYDPHVHTFHQPENGIVVKIGDNCPELDRLLEDSNANSACWLTISNPDVEPLTTLQEEGIDTRLYSEILQHVSKRRVLRGFAIDQTQEQRQKQGYLVIGISKKKVKELAFTYSQNSFVYYRRSGQAALVPGRIEQAKLLWDKYLISHNDTDIGLEIEIAGTSFRYIGRYLDNQQGIEPYFPEWDYPETSEMSSWTQFLMSANPNIIFSVLAHTIGDPLREFNREYLQNLDKQIITTLRHLVDKYTDEYNDFATYWDEYFECFTFGRFGSYANPQLEFPEVYIDGQLLGPEEFDDMFLSGPVFIRSEFYDQFIKDLRDASIQILKAIAVSRSNF